MADFMISINNLDRHTMALNNLALELRRYNDRKEAEIQLNTQANQQPNQIMAQTATVQPTIDPQTTVPSIMMHTDPPRPVVQSAAPTTQVPQTTIPTSHVAQAYTIEQLQVAMTPLLDSGKGDILQNIMQQFGVQSIVELPKEQYGALAAALRQVGAQI